MRHLLSFICVALLAVICVTPISRVWAADKVTSCEEVRKRDGSSINGGVGGFKPDGDQCFSGGGKQFCADASKSEFNREINCAGAVLTGEEPGELWAAFDYSPPPPPKPWEEMTPEERAAYNNLVLKQERNYHKTTTRDEFRGRAGKNERLYMNSPYNGVEICRVILNETGSIPPVFLGVKTEKEWQTVHGVGLAGLGSDATYGGYKAYMAGDDELPPMKVCCKPEYVEICGEKVSTNYVTINETVKLSSGEGYAEVTCVANNEFQVNMADGTCDDSNGGSEAGYYNPSNGGTISESDAKKNGVPPGYKKGQVNYTNKQGQEDMSDQADQSAANVAQAEKEAEEALRAWEEELEKKEEEARKAEEEARRKDGYGE